MNWDIGTNSRTGQTKHKHSDVNNPTWTIRQNGTGITALLNRCPKDSQTAGRNVEIAMIKATEAFSDDVFQDRRKGIRTYCSNNNQQTKGQVPAIKKRRHVCCTSSWTIQPNDTMMTSQIAAKQDTRQRCRNQAIGLNDHSETRNATGDGYIIDIYIKTPGSRLHCFREK